MKSKTKYFLIQKLLGAALVVLGVLSAVILEGDITVALMVVPLGIGVMLTKEEVLVGIYYEDDDE